MNLIFCAQPFASSLPSTRSWASPRSFSKLDPEELLPSTHFRKKQDQHWSNPVSEANSSTLSSAKVYSKCIHRIGFIFEVKNTQRHSASAYLTT